MKRIFSFFVGLVALSALPVFAFDEVQIKKIRMEGLQRISESTVLNYLAVKEGDTLTENKTSEAIRALFRTGFFNDVRLYADGTTLVVSLTERPSIAEVKIKGNEEISSDDLKKALKKTGLAEGQVFNRSLLEKVEQELERQYFSLGKYGVSVASTLLPQERNRVSVDIAIDEGEVARIRQIKLIGTKAFSEDVLLNQFQLSAHNRSFFGSSSKYAKQKLAADLESLRSYYLDRGYINFNIESTVVSISPDKKDVFITVNVTEGDQFMVESVGLSGDIIVDEKELRELLLSKAGDTFSRKSVTESSSKISERLGVEGYAFANVNAVPDVDKDKKSVKLTYFVDPGKRVYVRRVLFVGNTKTQEEVLRREMRQLEGAWISTTKLNRSKVRLQRMGFFEDVNIEMPPVAGRTDMVDVIFSVTERPSGNVTASLGYGQGSGFIVAASINQNNFLGTGSRVSAEVNNSQVNRVYSFSFTDPYYTLDGVSRGFRVYSRTTTSSAANIASYDTDVYGGSVEYGFPLSEYRSARVGVGYENTYVKTSPTTPQDYLDYVSRYGSTFDSITLDASWAFDTRNRTVFPDSGTYAVASSNFTLPGGNLTFYKASYHHQLYWALTRSLTAHFDALFAYGSGYGETDVLPFFENYFAGGGQSVRGFRDNSLGPKTTASRALGGNRKLTGTTELVFPFPFSEDSKSLRLSAFVDGGNVYGSGDTITPGSIRAAYGAGLIWITPVGALRFSWAWPLRSQPGDDTQRFQFSIGAPF